MGPKCPECGEPHELVEADIREVVYFDKFHSCSKCYATWVIPIDEYKQLQKDAAALYNILREDTDDGM